jgi:hypothetical protein
MIWEPEELKPVRKFLEDNKFSLLKGERDVYVNDLCMVRIFSDYYQVSSNKWPDTDEYGYLCSKDLNIYWLVGVLTWYGLIDKNYKGRII